jgi:hypothetical protein
VPSIGNVFGTSTAPAGQQQMIVLTDEERDKFTLAGLRGLFIDIDAEIAKAKADNVESKVTIRNRFDDVVRPGGFHGSQVIFDYKLDDATLTFNQTALFDSESRIAYLFVIGCEASCYVRNIDAIDDVVQSWTIEEHK